MTHDEYVAELAIRNPNIEVIGEYVNMGVSIMHRCKNHDYEWMVTPGNALRYKGCPKCSKRYRRTHEDYVAELKEVNPNLIVLGTYINARTKILHRCIVHDVEWEAYPYLTLKGCGCRKCGSDLTTPLKTKTTKQYKEELAQINPNIEVLEEYQKAYIPILHKCKIDGYTWKAKPQNLLSHTGCPKCNKYYRRTVEEYVEELSIASPNVELVEGYKNLTTKAVHKCKVCNYVWETKPEVMLRGCGCPKCGNKINGAKRTKSQEQYEKELSMINPNIEIIDKYINSLTPVRHRCKIDNYEWFVTPAHLLHDTGCPICASSKGETKVKEWLEAKNINYEPQKRFKGCKDKKTLPFDFYLPDLNICIEYDGEQHFRPVTFNGTDLAVCERNFETTKKHDEMKNKYCEDNGIRLIRIPYYENVKEKLDLLLA